MTHDKHRKQAIRDEAERRNLPYQTVLQERWRPGDEAGLRRKLADAIRPVVATWERSQTKPDDESIGALLDRLIDIALEKPWTPHAEFRIELPPGDEVGPAKTEWCMRAISRFVSECGTPFDESHARTTALTLAVAPIVVRRCPGHEVASDRQEVGKRADSWLSGDDYENEWMPDMGD